MHVTAIVLAAGKGLRLGTKVSKPLIEISSRPLITYSLRTLNLHPNIKDIVVMANPENFKNICQAIMRYRIAKAKDIILGGRRRQDSVACGLAAIKKDTDLVLIHDASRPFIDRGIISSTIKTARKYGAAIAAVPVKATVKEVTRSPGHQVTSRYIVKKTLNRENLWEIQTPQVFKKELILEAYKRFPHVEATDDAFLVEKLGKPVRVVMGSYFNLKITTPEDLVAAEAIAKNVM